MIGFQNAFPKEEYDQRALSVRTHMREQALDCLLLTVPENIYYMTGYQTFGEAAQFLIVPVEGPTTLVLRELESHLASIMTYDQNVQTFGEGDNGLNASCRALKSAGYGEAHIGFEASGLDGDVGERIVSALPNARTSQANGLVEKSRRIKSPMEIATCREAARLTDVGMNAAYEVLGPGISENEVASAAFAAMTSEGSEWLTLDPIVTSGWRSGIPHTTYARRILEPGDSVLLEFSGCYYRYNAPLMRSSVIGAPGEPGIRRMYTACADALKAAVDKIKPGVSSGEAHDAAQKQIDKAGFNENFRKRLGYAVGIGFDTWSEGHIFDLKAGDDRKIEAGMVIHMPPALRKIGEFGVGLSQTIVVTNEGAEPLSSIDLELVEK